MDHFDGASDDSQSIWWRQKILSSWYTLQKKQFNVYFVHFLKKKNWCMFDILSLRVCQNYVEHHRDFAKDTFYIVL